MWEALLERLMVLEIYCNQLQALKTWLIDKTKQKYYPAGIMYANRIFFFLHIFNKNALIYSTFADRHFIWFVLSAASVISQMAFMTKCQLNKNSCWCCFIHVCCIFKLCMRERAREQKPLCVTAPSRNGMQVLPDLHPKPKFLQGFNLYPVHTPAWFR